jgi:4-azaleucine resistance transporter AzlC
MTSLFKITFPVLLGYLAIGIPFGLMVVDANLPWYTAPAMSIFIYAGAGQYIALPMIVNGVPIIQIAIVIFLINSRHMVYGLSLINKFHGLGIIKPYVIFALTDETYSLFTSVQEDKTFSNKEFYGYIALLDHIYWISGSIIGSLFGMFFPVNTEGISFALTGLFVVLMIDQYKSVKSNIPFFIALLSSTATLLLIGKENFLIISIAISIFLLILLKPLIKKNSEKKHEL